IEITIKEGSGMEYVIEKMEAIKMIGFEKLIPMGEGYQKAPEFWDEFHEKYSQAPAAEAGEAEKEVRRAIADNQIGEFGVCIDDNVEEGYFRYMIAGRYMGGKVPEEMKLFEIPACSWAKFKCVGPMPEAFQAVNTRIFKEWLPGNPQYEPAFGINVEWYSDGDMDSESYESSIWIPVKSRH
ncbi:MAG: GyrI-like domain-containing protein, partial [Clostridium sp.]|nr:GyrI-like domain-containing protein [Clostridium sp.]